MDNPYQSPGSFPSSRADAIVGLEAFIELYKNRIHEVRSVEGKQGEAVGRIQRRHAQRIQVTNTIKDCRGMKHCIG